MAMVICIDCGALVDSIEATPTQPTPKINWVCNYFCDGEERYG